IVETGHLLVEEAEKDLRRVGIRGSEAKREPARALGGNERRGELFRRLGAKRLGEQAVIEDHYLQRRLAPQAADVLHFFDHFLDRAHERRGFVDARHVRCRATMRHLPGRARRRQRRKGTDSDGGFRKWRGGRVRGRRARILVRRRRGGRDRGRRRGRWYGFRRAARGDWRGIGDRLEAEARAQEPRNLL